MTAKDEFGERLRAAMKAAGMKPSKTELWHAFNRRWGQSPVTLQAVADWINGKSIPRHDKVPVLAAVLNVDPHALLYGSTKRLTAADRRREWEDRMTYAERESIEAFLRLPTPQRLIVRDVIATYAKAHGALQPSKE